MRFETGLYGLMKRWTSFVSLHLPGERRGRLPTSRQRHVLRNSSKVILRCTVGSDQCMILDCSELLKSWNADKVRDPSGSVNQLAVFKFMVNNSPTLVPLCSRSNRRNLRHVVGIGFHIPSSDRTRSCHQCLASSRIHNKMPGRTFTCRRLHCAQPFLDFL